MLVLDNLEYWIKEFTTISGPKHNREQLFKPSDAFIGFQVDTPAAVVFEASSILNKEKDITFDDREKVLTQSKYLLLRTASPDALVRLGHTQLSEEEQQQLHKIYFDEQHHSSIEDFLVHHLQQCEGGGVLMQVVIHLQSRQEHLYFVLHILFATVSRPMNRMSRIYFYHTLPAGPKITLRFLSVSMYVSLCIPTYCVQ